ncbi:hypothetical protein HOO54_18730 [Bacillus sp. WMMC1349]|uniref:hypothetical protein n=1 Tax=Bacillus sp. WMMC1349 TaxID=2736254 RepID=UPI001557DD2B|nr:hypothetical protein [Bacillus sp. WMMC1349]NPC94199.1 hypothetical protein [Bacillus sp. WMMC1349]
MNPIRSVCKGSFTFIKPYLYIFLALEFIHFFINIILAAAGINNHIEVSHANVFTAFLFIIPIFLPLFVFKYVLYLGASRKSYFLGIVYLFIVSTCIYSIFNIVWYFFEKHVLIEYKDYFNLIDIFDWNQFGVSGMFLYQFSAYLLVISFLFLLFSAFWCKKGIVLWMGTATVIAVSMSIGQLRGMTTEIVGFLLYNRVLWISVVCEIALTLMIFLCSWKLFVKQRQI